MDVKIRQFDDLKVRVLKKYVSFFSSEPDSSHAGISTMIKKETLINALNDLETKRSVSIYKPESNSEGRDDSTYIALSTEGHEVVFHHFKEGEGDNGYQHRLSLQQFEELSEFVRS